MADAAFQQVEIPPLVAHTPNSTGAWHELLDHLISVGDIAESFGKSFGAGSLARWSGRWHDVGKSDPRFRQYLIDSAAGTETASPGIGHAAAGAVLASELGLAPVALMVFGHHSGLPARRELPERVARARADPGTLDALAIAAEIPELQLDGPAEMHVPDWLRSGTRRDSRLRGELLTRMVFSCLIDADRLDTERHFDRGRFERREGRVDLAAVAVRFGQQRKASLRARADDPVSTLRERIRGAVVSTASAANRNFFTFTSPTGSGKTLTVLEAALAHARRHEMRQIVVAVPFISVTEQVAGVYRNLVDEGGDAVLEHHSAVVADDTNQGLAGIRSRAAQENWDMPLTVTTTVRLLESLLSNRPSDCRRLHRLANSVVVIDEAQSIPWRLLDAATVVLAQLVEDFGATVILMTATQPPFAALPVFTDSDTQPVELLADHVEYFHDFRRATAVVVPGKISWAELVNEVTARSMATAGQALVVLNTIADAETVFGLVRHESGALLLSSRLCQAHRRQVLAEATSRIASGKPALLISTQLIEAGVDIDFPLGFRAIGPIPSIAQVAGRVNRHGLRSSGSLIVFDPESGAVPPGEYKIGTSLARSLLANGADPLSLQTVQRYFESFLAAMRSQLDELGIEQLRLNGDFPGVAESFRLIEDDTVSVLVPFGDFDPSDLANPPNIHELRRRVRRAQAYTVSLRRGVYEQAVADQLAEEVAGFPIRRWVGGYDGKTGLLLHNKTTVEVW